MSTVERLVCKRDTVDVIGTGVLKWRMETKREETVAVVVDGRGEGRKIDGALRYRGTCVKN